MLRILDEMSGDDLVAVRVSGRLEHDDYLTFIPRLEAVIRERGAVRCLIDISEMDSIQLRAVWDELSFDLKHAAEVSRCAVVGNHRWQRWATDLSRFVFRNAQIRFFSPEEMEAASAWIRSEQPASA